MFVDFFFLLDTPATVGLVILILIISIYNFYNDELMDKFSLMPYEVIRDKAFYQLITSGFLHGSIQHLALNLFVFIIFGSHFERTLGSVSLLVVYFIGLIFSNLVTVIKFRYRSAYQSVGASGAISAIVLGTIVVFPQLEMLLFFFLPIPGWLFAVAYLLFSIYGAGFSEGNINHDAHLWGAISGIICTFLIFPKALEIWEAFIMMS